MSTTQLADACQAGADRRGRLLLLPLLVAATGLAALSVDGGYGTAHAGQSFLSPAVAGTLMGRLGDHNPGALSPRELEVRGLLGSSTA